MLTVYNPAKFVETDFVSDIIDINNKLKHTNYPVVDKNNKCLQLTWRAVFVGKVYFHCQRMMILRTSFFLSSSGHVWNVGLHFSGSIYLYCYMVSSLDQKSILRW